jgi:hypothetical protein
MNTNLCQLSLACLALEIKQPITHRRQHQSSRISGLGFFEQVIAMALNGALTEEEFFGNFAGS